MIEVKKSIAKQCDPKYGSRWGWFNRPLWEAMLALLLASFYVSFLQFL